MNAHQQEHRLDHSHDAGWEQTEAHMGTIVSVRVVGHGSSQRSRRERSQAITRALAWFARVEAVCSRFDANSELRRLSTRVGVAVPVSNMLFEAVQFAVAVADATNGVFDPTVGHRMEQRGFNRHHRTGESIDATVHVDDDVSFRDVHLNAAARTITLRRAVMLDLGAVAKGLAIDMAVRELAPLANFCVYAGGDVFVGGHNADDTPWRVGIRHPFDMSAMIDAVRVSDVSVCTSSEAEQPNHIVRDAVDVVSATVVAPSAMVADALATAAYALGARDGLEFLQSQQVAGLLLTSALDRVHTASWMEIAA